MRANQYGLLAPGAALAVAVAAQADLVLDRFTCSAGAGWSFGGGYELVGTVGQADAGVLAGGPFVLMGGFWSGTEATWTPGDPNCDGAVNFDDIDPFLLALSGGAAYEAAYPHCRRLNGDCNRDGTVDFDDIDAFVAALGN